MAVPVLAVSPAGLRDPTDATLEFGEEEEDDEVREERELEMFDETNDRLEHSSWRPQRLCPFTAGRREDGWSCTFAHGEQRAPPVHLSCSRTWTRQCRRSLLSS